MSSNQTNPTSTEQNAAQNHGQAPRNTPESPADARARRQSQTQTGVGHPSPSEVTVRPQVQTTIGHTGNTSAQNQATMNNGQTSALAYLGQNVQVNPPADAYTGTHNNGQASQASQMPTQAVNSTALAYSVMNAYQHGGSQAAGYGYMHP